MRTIDDRPYGGLGGIRITDGFFYDAIRCKAERINAFPTADLIDLYTQ